MFGLLLSTLLHAAPPSADEAATALAMRGRGVEALALLDQADPDDAVAHFIRGCVLLERGDLTRAREEARKVRLLRSTAVEGPILEALVERRRSNPKESWSNSLVAAWSNTGRIRSSCATLVDLPPIERILDANKLAAISGTSDEFLVRVRLAAGGDMTARALSEIGRDRVTAATLWVAAAVILQKPPPGTPGSVERSAAQRAYERIAALDPTDGYAAAGAVLLDDRPLDLDRLAVALTRKRFQLPVGVAFDGFRAAFLKVDPEQADVRAFEAATTEIGLFVQLELSRRLALEGPRGAELLALAAKRLMAAPTRMDRQVGFDLSPHADHEQSWSVYGLGDATRDSTYLVWPVPTLQAELKRRRTHDELVFEAGLVGATALSDVRVRFDQQPPTPFTLRVRDKGGRVAVTLLESGCGGSFLDVVVPSDAATIELSETMPDGRTCSVQLARQPQPGYQALALHVTKPTICSVTQFEEPDLAGAKARDLPFVPPAKLLPRDPTLPPDPLED